MKKILALLLALLLAASAMGCGSEAPAETTAAPTEPKETPGAEILPTYTYNIALSSLPAAWNPHTAQGTASEILEYITDGFYRWELNPSGDGSIPVPAMAAAEPVDITESYIGQFGITEGDTGLVWRIDLREDLQWQDGTPITARDYVESAKRLLDPAAGNSRSESLCDGSAVIRGVENYILQGTGVSLLENASAPEKYTLEDLTLNENGVYVTPQGNTVYIALDVPLLWLGGRTLTACVEEHGAFRYNMTRWKYLSGRKTSNGCAPLTQETLSNLIHTISDVAANGETEEDFLNYLVYDYTYPELSWEEVGIFALSDRELVYVLESPLSGIPLLEALPDDYLVHTALYDSCQVLTGGVLTSTYGTSPETTMSYGPYRLTSYEPGTRITLEKNDAYYGLTGDTYQTTDIVIDCVPEASARLDLFNQGLLDVYDLTAGDMETYRLSDACRYTVGSCTFAIAFNPGPDSILSLPEFRKAMSAAVDRGAFCLAAAPTAMPALGLFSRLFLADPETGVSYRSTEAGKAALSALPGYDPDTARQLFDSAWETAIASGLLGEEDTVTLRVGVPNSTSAFYSSGYEFLVSCYTEALRGTKLEGKVTFSLDDTLGNDCVTALRDHRVDMLFGVTWPGSPLDPYRLMEAYLNPAYQMDPATDYSSLSLDISLDGVTRTASAWDWYGTLAESDPDTRITVLASLERAVLENYCFLPLMHDASAHLQSLQIACPTDGNLYGLGHGGLRYLTYRYDDAAWESYTASHNGLLDYT